MLAKAQRELKASPLNPKLETPSKSEYSLSFEVWCLSAAKYLQFEKGCKGKYNLRIYMILKVHLFWEHTE